jgi:hypothetical protein
MLSTSVELLQQGWPSGIELGIPDSVCVNRVWRVRECLAILTFTSC